MKKKSVLVVLGMACCMMVSACGGGASTGDNGAQTGDVQMEQAQDAAGTGVADGQQDAAVSAADDAGATIPDGATLIEEQSFDVELNSLGTVKFESYAPDKTNNTMGDVVFFVSSEGKESVALEGIEATNVRDDRCFVNVEAVSFPDYDNDNLNDIITICSYEMTTDGADGSVAGDIVSEIRLYHGESDGSFVLDRELSEETDSALAEKTVKSVLGFLGSDAGTDVSDEVWQDYIDAIEQQEDASVAGYEMIYLDGDSIPELVAIGDCEATGCRILSWYDGTVYESQLSRLYFTYIERANLLCNTEGLMDSYYDIIYCLKDGKLVKVAEGYYGAEDNSNVQYDENDEPIYCYEWEGVPVTKEEYQKALNEIYNQEEAMTGYSWDAYLSKDDMIKKLKEKM